MEKKAHIPLIKLPAVKFNQTSLLLIMIVLLITVISLFSSSFLTWMNIRNVLMQNAIAGIIAVGMTIVMISGGIDLSVGNQLSFIGCLLALMIKNGIKDLLAVCIALVLSTVLSLLAGLIIANTSAQPFIITLGLMSVYRALALLVSNGADIPIRSFAWLGQTRVAGLILPVWIFLLLFVLVALMFKYTRFGRNVYSIGSNQQAAYISGIAIKRMKVAIYSLNGLIVGFAAAVMLSRLGSAVPTMGDGYELNAIASCAIGGITLAGGSGGAFGALLGVLFLGIVRNGLNIIGVPSFYQYLVNGTIIIIAVLMSNLYGEKKQ